MPHQLPMSVTLLLEFTRGFLLPRLEPVRPATASSSFYGRGDLVVTWFTEGHRWQHLCHLALSSLPLALGNSCPRGHWCHGEDRSQARALSVR